MNTLENEIFRIELATEPGTFSILTSDAALPNLLGCRMSLEYSLDGKARKQVLRSWQSLTSVPQSVPLAAQGDVEMLRFRVPEDENGIFVNLDFGIVQEYPLVIWKAEIVNHGSQAVMINRMIMLDVDPSQGVVELSQAQSPGQMGFFSNGWQSWSTTQWYPADGKMQHSRLGGLQLPMTQYSGTPLMNRPGDFSSDFFAVLGDRAARTGFLVGFLSQKQQFGSITSKFGRSIALQMWANGDGARLDPQKTMETDWAVFNPVLLDHRTPLEKYLEAVARENDVKIPREVPLGWCSWYQYYTHITADEVRKNLHSIGGMAEQLPVQLVQIDDGFETQVGDWFTFKKPFPGGVKPLAEEISNEGLIPGLWLAPFAVHPKSRLFKEHPEWILRKRNGRPVNAGYGWGKLFTSLDLTVPAALKYAAAVVRTASQEWGFPYLKLDFLYTAALPGVYSDETRTRAQVMRSGMETIREAVGPEVFLLGCGAPLGSVLGLVDANRIGPDVSGSWTPEIAGFKSVFLNEPGMPSARNSLRNVLTRANLHGHWWANDPDCLLLRENTRLTLAEVRSLASVIALTGGSLLISDDLSQVKPERLRITESLIPLMDAPVQVLDWFDHEMPEKLRVDLLNETGGWYAAGAFNWSRYPARYRISPATFRLDEGEYWVCEFWSGKLYKISNQKPAIFEDVAPHGGLVLGIRRAEDRALYLGSDLHISQGMEVADWTESLEGVEFKLRLPRSAEGNVVLRLPREVDRVLVNGTALECKPVSDEVLQIPIKMEGFADVEVIYRK